MRTDDAYCVDQAKMVISSKKTPICSSQEKSKNTISKKCITTIKKKTKKGTDDLHRPSVTSSIKKSRSNSARAITFSPISPIVSNDIQNEADRILSNHGINADIFDSSLCSEPDEFDELFAKTQTRANVSVGDCLKEMFDGCDGCAPVFLNKHFLEASTPKAISSDSAFSKIDSSIKQTPIQHKNELDFSDNELATHLPFFNVSILPSFNISESSFNTSIKTPKAHTFFSPVAKSSTPCSNNFKTPKASGPFYSPILKTSTPPCSLQLINSPIISYNVKTPKPQDIDELFEEASQEPDIPIEIKKTILAGLCCFVDVKTDKENCSDAVAQEVISMGAKVEKSLNKKVTHLIFKEGRPSTYKRAKTLGVVIVSVIWLEACKRERKMVDAALYPPIDEEKYNELSSMSLRMPSLKTIQRKLRQHMLRRAGINISSSKSAECKPRGSARSAITVEKDQLVPATESNNKHCIKKLDFSVKDVSQDPDDSVIIVSPEKSNLVNQNVLAVRRNSAPGLLLPSHKRKRDDDPKKGEIKKYITIDKMFAKQTQSQMYSSEEKENIIPTNNGSPSPKKRKLFDPSETLILSDDSTPMTPPVSICYEDLKCTTKKVCRTRLTSSKRKIKKITVSKRPGTLNRFDEEEAEEESKNISRNSLTLFVNPKETKSKPVSKEPPSIVCTSFSLEEMQKAGYIVGRLGTYDLEDRVSSRTTHVVSAGPRRTINLLLAIVRGCWLVDIKWLLESEKADRWVSEEEFEMKSFSPAVMECRMERRAFGSRYCMEIFAGVGGIYVSKRSSPPKRDLQELIQLCRGTLVTRPAAAIVIGGDPRPGDSTVRVKEKWVLDSITNNTLLPIEKYRISK